MEAVVNDCFVWHLNSNLTNAAASRKKNTDRHPLTVYTVAFVQISKYVLVFS